MPDKIDKKILEHLAELARIKIEEKDEEKLLKDLESILGYFDELEEVDADKIEPLSGGAMLENIKREDIVNPENAQRADKIIDSFPEREGRSLKIPPVFSAEGGSASGGEQDSDANIRIYE